MKPKSSDKLGGQSAQDKWQSLFKMFKEWKQQTSIAKGEYLFVSLHRQKRSRLTTVLIRQRLKEDKAKQVAEDIINLRKAIQSLRQRKDLTKEENELLTKSTARLRELMEEQKHV